MDLQGISAIVSGGASGLGLATAQALHKAGARVAVFDVNPDALQSVAAQGALLPVHCDVTDADSAEAAFAQAAAAHGTARLLVSCAGVAPAARIVGRAGPMALADFRRVVDINLIGSFNLLRLAAARMQSLPVLDDGERGLVVLTASIAAYEGQIGQSAYAASKAGVAGLVLPAARELAQGGVRVCGIAPGVFQTPMVAAMPDVVKTALAADVPFPRRLGHPTEYAELVLHLASNRMLNGCMLRLDGAHRMGVR